MYQWRNTLGRTVRWILKQPQLWSWKLRYAVSKLARRTSAEVSQARRTFDLSEIQNILPNSGGVPLDPAGIDPKDLLFSMREQPNRQTGVSGFEGLALDDALVYADSYKHYSFFRLAKAVNRISREHLGRDRCSILELGCGGGDLSGSCALWAFKAIWEWMRTRSPLHTVPTSASTQDVFGY